MQDTATRETMFLATEVKGLRDQCDANTLNLSRVNEEIATNFRDMRTGLCDDFAAMLRAAQRRPSPGAPAGSQRREATEPAADPRSKVARSEGLVSVGGGPLDASAQGFAGVQQPGLGWPFEENEAAAGAPTDEKVVVNLTCMDEDD